MKTVLRPSAAHRWMRCPGSVRLCADLPDTAGSAALDGTAMHALAEHCLRNGEVSSESYVGASFSEFTASPGAAWAKGRTVMPEHVETVDAYLDAVWPHVLTDALLFVEQTGTALETERSVVRGTADCVVLSPSESGATLRVFDLKTGFNFVDAASPQLAIYALGAWSDPDTAGSGVSRFTTTVVQPRAIGADPVREHVRDAIDMAEFAADLAAAVARTEAPDAPLVSGAHCEHCPAQKHNKCPLRQRELASVFEEIEAPDRLSLRGTDDLAAMLDRARAVISYAEDLADLVKSRAKSGERVPGWKWVAGRSARAWAQADTATIALVRDRTGVDISETVALSPARAEKAIGKAAFQSLGDLIARKDAAPSFVPESDRRPAIDITTCNGNSFEDVT